jgi:SAM-dependent methyltransferase
VANTVRPPGSTGLDETTWRDREFHRQIAQVYEQELGPEYAIYVDWIVEPALRWLRAHAPADGPRALDVGCGTGVMTMRLAHHGFDVVGVDHSTEMLAIARGKRGPGGGGPQVKFVEGDVRALPFPAASFDVLTGQGVLHHLAELAPCVGEIARVLKPGGAFYLAEPCDSPTFISRGWPALWRLVASRSRRARRDSPSGNPQIAVAQAPAPPAPTVVADEAPISSAELRAALDAVGLAHEMRYVTHLPGLERILPDTPRLVLTQLVSAPWRRVRGDVVYVRGHKGA